MQRTLYLFYGLINYFLFLAVYAYLAAFFGNFVVPKTIDAPAGGAAWESVAVDLGLVLLFGLQHSVMARPGFKRVWTRIVPHPIERSTYLLASNAALVLLVWAWRPLDTVVWDVTDPTARTAIWTLFAIGWFGVPAVSLLINHFDLFGLRQVWLHWQRQEYAALPFRTPLIYGHIRHPLYVAWALAFWSTPTMTVGHLLLAAGLTAYMVVAVVWEERDLIAHFGEQYLHYRRHVPKFVPRFGRPKADRRMKADSGELQPATEVA